MITNGFKLFGGVLTPPPYLVYNYIFRLGILTMNNFQNGFQSDITNTANNMMTQMMCAEKGIDYNQLMQQAQQAHINSILQAEQQRQINNLVKRHYQGSGFLSKVKEAFNTGTQMNMINTGFVMPMTPVQPQYQAPTMTQEQSNQFVHAQQPRYESVPVGDDDNRINQLEQQMSDMQQMLQSIAGSLKSKG